VAHEKKEWLLAHSRGIHLGFATAQFLP
jgi:hypothetical protein